MRQETFSLLESYMSACMGDSAHDREHVRRVLYLALEIGSTEPDADRDVLIAACLLHDIGREEQFRDPGLCHARVGAEKAYRFLLEQGFPEGFAAHVRDCVRTHRFRSGDPPASIEAKILFDADKLDATGAIGMARTFFYAAQVGQPLYSRLPDGAVSDGSAEEPPGCHSVLREYKVKLEKIYDRFLTARGGEIARRRQAAAVSLYNDILAEAREPYEAGGRLLRESIGSSEGERQP